VTPSENDGSAGPLDRDSRLPARLVLLGLALAALGVAALWAPLHLLDPATRIVLDPEDTTPEQGLAFQVRVPVDEPSDLHGRSRLRLREDGVDLEPHADQAQIREQGGGRFVHLGDRVLFAPTDGSDPRTSGRSYELLRPSRRIGAWQGTCALIALVAGALIAVLGSLRGSAPAKAAAAACVLAAAWGVVSSRPDARTEALEGWGEGAASIRGSTASGMGTPRTRRLLEPDGEIAFEARGEAPSAKPPLELGLVRQDGSPAEGMIALQALEPLTAVVTGDLPARAVYEIQLRVRVVAGDQLGLLFHFGPQDKGELLRVPVEPSGEWSTISITQPLLMTQRPEQIVTRIQVGSPLESSEPLRLEVLPLVVKRADTRFSGATHGWSRVEVGGSLRPSFWQSVPGEVRLTDGLGAGRLRAAVATLGGGARVRLLPGGNGGDGDEALELVVHEDQGWAEFDISVPALDALTLDVMELDAGATVLWSGLRLIDEQRPPRRVVLVLMDTLRADALSCYGSSRARTPTLDGLASQGVRFERSYSQSHWTRPSLASVMTGRYATATGVQTLGARLPSTYGTLAEAFRAEGFRTVAFITNTNAGPAAGLQQGFDEIVLERTQVARTLLEDHALPRALALGADDLFLYVHLMDAHGPYGPPVRPDGWVAPAGAPVDRVPARDPRWVESPTDASRVALYHLDVERMDQALGAFLTSLMDAWEADGSPPVVVAAMSDHGEMLGESGRWGHERFLHVPELVHVPLILRAPGQLPAGAAWPHPVENRSVGATLLQLVGARPPDGFGPGLLTRVLGEREPTGPQLAISSDEAGQATLFSVFGPEGGLLGSAGDLVELTDPEHRWQGAPAAASLWELASLAEGSFREIWRAFLQKHDAERDELWSEAVDEAMAIDAAQLEQLRALGYLGY
jgi:hypothetical protein